LSRGDGFGVERKTAEGEARLRDCGDFSEDAGRREGEDAGRGCGGTLCEFGFKGGPCGVEQAVGALDADTGSGGDGGAEEMEFAAGSGAGDVEETFAFLVEAHLALFADPAVKGLSVFSLKAEGGDEEFGFAGGLRFGDRCGSRI
jgi:hypothetical protein